MIVVRKTLRYYWWLIIEFLTRHSKIILISFLTTFIILIGITSVYPHIESFFTQKKEIIGLVGNYDLNNPPEEITSKISNGLIYINDKGQIIPLLVASWKKKNNGSAFRFYLKDDLLWNDGKKFETNDINYRFKDVTIKVVNTNTIDFYLNKPLAIFPTYLTKPLIRYPLIGIAGLYRVVNLKTKNGQIISLTLIPQKKDLPMLIYKFYDNENQLILAYKKGEITKMKLTKKAVAESFINWKNTKVTKTVDYSRLMTLFYNQNNSFLKSKEIREAIFMGIDFNNFIDLGEIAKGPIPPNSWAYNPNLKNPVFNPESTEKIIRKELTATKEAKLNFITYYDYYSVADSLITDLKKIGLTINLNVISSVKPSQFDLFLAFWRVPIDPDQYYFWHSTQTEGNIGHYKNVKVDKLLEDGRNTILPSERKKIYFELQRLIQDDPPALFLYFPYVYTIERR